MWLLLLACTATTTTPLAPRYLVPDGATVALHDPDADVAVWPDDAQRPADQGGRVTLTPGARESLGADLTPQILLLEGLDELDGFGVNGGAFFRFSAPLDPATVEGAVRGVRLDDGAPVSFDWSLTDEGATLLIHQRRPLEPSASYAWVVSAALRDLQGDPVWASPWSHAALRAGDARGARMSAAAEHVGLGADEIVDVTVFTTRDPRARDREAAAWLATTTPTWTLRTCADEPPLQRCELTLTVVDLLGEDDRLTPDEPLAAQRTYELPVTAWMPADRGPAPLQVILHGHGLSGDRYEARRVASDLADLGFAVLAVDAPKHGDHPSTTSDADLLWVLEMFGISTATGTFDPRVLRDQFRRSAYDRLQLAAAARANPDLDGDGVPDLDGSFLAWTGHSLGGLLGPQLTALDPTIEGAVLSVPGARMADIVRYGQVFSPLIALMAPPGTSTGTIDRFFPLLQAVIDEGDPATWGAELGETEQDVLMSLVLDDEIMPNPTTAYLARAIGVELAGPEVLPIPELARYAGALPVRGNVDGDTLVMWQFDVLHDDGRAQTASHSDALSSDEGTLQLRAFLDGVRADGQGVVPAPEAP